MIATLVRSIFEQPDRDATWSELGDVVDRLTQAGFCDVANDVLDAADDILAFSTFPVEHWAQIRSNNPQERLNKEIRRRTDVVGIFPTRAAVIRLVGALLAEQTDEWGHRPAVHERRNARQAPPPRHHPDRPDSRHRSRRHRLTSSPPAPAVTGATIRGGIGQTRTPHHRN